LFVWRPHFFLIFTRLYWLKRKNIFLKRYIFGYRVFSTCHLEVTSNSGATYLSVNDETVLVKTIKLFQLTHISNRQDFIFQNVSWATFDSIISINETQCCKIMRTNPGKLEILSCYRKFRLKGNPCNRKGRHKLI